MVGIWVEGNVGNSEGRGIGRVGKSAMIDTLLNCYSAVPTDISRAQSLL